MKNLENFFTPEIIESVINNSVSEDIKLIIKSVYKAVLRKEINETCSNCFTDAFFELYNLYQRDVQKFNALFESEYSLEYGAVLSLFSDVSTIATKDNITNELAELHLHANPNCISQFSAYPEDWEERVEKRFSVAEVKVVELTPDTSTDLPEDLPARQKLIDAGFDTLEKVKACTDFADIKGISNTTAKQITDYLGEPEQPEQADKIETPKLTPDTSTDLPEDLPANENTGSAPEDTTKDLPIV